MRLFRRWAQRGKRRGAHRGSQAERAWFADSFDRPAAKGVMTYVPVPDDDLVAVGVLLGEALRPVRRPGSSG
jgi:hypothetical protein